MFDFVTSFEGIVGVVLGLVILAFLFVLNGYRNEKDDAEYLRGSLRGARDFANSHWTTLREEQRLGNVWKAEIGDLQTRLDDADARAKQADELMGEASTLIEAFIVELDDADEDLVDLEDEVDELEAELVEVVAGWEDANALVGKTIAWGTRILDTLDKSGPGVYKPRGYVFGERD